MSTDALNPPIATIIRTGIANTASVAAALDRAGCVVHLTNYPAAVECADLLVLPGVGAFGAGMAHLREHNLIEPITRRIRQGRATLAICLGMQLLCARSEETPGVEGLGIIDAPIERFPEGAITPQFGWNTVNPDDSFAWSRAGSAYFANSYRLAAAPEGWSCLWSNHAGPFVAAIRRGNVLACQFHPELSGHFGAALLRTWVNSGMAALANDEANTNTSTNANAQNSSGAATC
jgi:imidazole glycerol phosphate synthase glutamine amidotransferase subunit